MTLQDVTVEQQFPAVAEVLVSTIYKYITLAVNKCGYIGTAEYLMVNCVHLLFLESKSTASGEDNNNWHEANTGPFADEYWKAIKTEIQTLGSMGSWNIDELDDDVNFIQSACYFKCNPYLYSIIKKFKDKFYARVHQQLQGIDFFKAYAPAVKWKMVRLMLTIDLFLGLKSKQGDVTDSFIHAYI